MTTYALETLKAYLEALGYSDISLDEQNKLLAFNASSGELSFTIVVSSFKLEFNYVKFSVFPTKSNGEFIDINEFGQKSSIIMNRMLAYNSIDNSVGTWALDGDSIAWHTSLKTPKNWMVDLDDVKEVFNIIVKENVSNISQIFFE